MAYPMEYSSVDLTEDEDSRETITDVSETPQLSYFSYAEVNGNIPRLKTLSPCTPPPLTPICEINSLRDRKLLGNQHRTVPKLKKIQRSNNNSGGQTTLSQQIYFNQSENRSLNVNYDHPTFQEKFVEYQSNVTPRTAIGKEWNIKKNGKVYKIVIPHNVMPSLNESNGSVVVNVPEVGPIMLKINPHYKDNSVSQLEPFSLNFDEIMESTTEPEEPSYTVPVENVSQKISPIVNDVNLLFDSRFCWIQPKYKHYAYSFKDNFTGFSKTDMQKARRCVRNFTLSSKKLENILEGKKTESGKKHNKHSNKIINSINNSFVQLQNVSATNPNVGSVSIETFNNNFSQNSWVPSHIDNMEIEDVLTPNILINIDSSYEDNIGLKNFDYSTLDTSQEYNTYISTRHSKMPLQRIKKKSNYINLKPCFVRVVKDKQIEQLIKNCTNPKLVNNIKVTSKKSAKALSFSHNFEILSSNIINTEIKFKSTISYLKPLLILNEFNFENILYLSEFCKSNIVYTVYRRTFPKRMLENEEFVLAVKQGFVKLVDFNLLLRYLKGEIGPVALSNKT